MKGYFVACLMVVLSATIWGIQGEVITLHHSNFSQIVSKHNFIVLKFFSPWCDHSKSLAPEYEKAAAELIKNDPPITLGKIDATDVENREIVFNHNVQHTPTLIIITNNGETTKHHYYKGSRKAAGIVKYLKNKLLGPPSTEIKSKADVHNAIDQKKIFILGVFPKFSGEKYENFIKVAEKLRFDYDFGHVLDSTGPFIRLLKPFDEFVADSENFDIDTLEKFIEEEDSPSFVEFSLDQINVHLENLFFSNNTKVIMVLDYKAKNADALKTKFYDIAYLLKDGNLGFVIGDVEPSKLLLQNFKLDKLKAPLIFVLANDGKMYVKENVAADEVVIWLKKALVGKIKEYNNVDTSPMTNENTFEVLEEQESDKKNTNDNGVEQQREESILAAKDEL